MTATMMARTCTSLLEPPFYSWPLREPKFEYFDTNLALRNFIGPKVCEPGIWLVVQHDRRKSHRTEHSPIPDVLPVLLYALLTWWQGLKGLKYKSAPKL